VEETWELAAVRNDKIEKVSDSSKKMVIILDERFLRGSKPTLSNIRIDLDRDQSPMTDDQVKTLIEALQRSEINTLGYAAAAFAPVLFLLSSMEFFQDLNDLTVDRLALVATCVLGFSGFYYACYKALYLSPRRIYLEGYLSGLVLSFRTHLFPGGFWLVPNTLALLLIPVGYSLLLAILIRVLLA
jgi:hypothetical protein